MNPAINPHVVGQRAAQPGRLIATSTANERRVKLNKNNCPENRNAIESRTKSEGAQTVGRPKKAFNFWASSVFPGRLEKGAITHWRHPIHKNRRRCQEKNFCHTSLFLPGSEHRISMAHFTRFPHPLFFLKLSWVAPVTFRVPFSSVSYRVRETLSTIAINYVRVPWTMDQLGISKGN